MNISGKYTTAQIFSEVSVPAANQLIRKLCDQPCMVDTNVCVMPDYHVANGISVGLTVLGMKQYIPNLLGNDLGCGVLVAKLSETALDFPKLDQFIMEHFQPVLGKPVQNGRAKIACPAVLERNGFFQQHYTETMTALGTLGSGNHFIEVVQDEEGTFYLMIHTGSRSFGKRVTETYQKKAQESLDFYDRIHRPKHLACLPEAMTNEYLRDVMAAQQFADWNRATIRQLIVEAMGWYVVEEFSTVHNYVDEQGVVRKGAISAKSGEKLVIPLNMKEGALLGTGLGNETWNCSAPHGLGRKMSRTEAKKQLSVDHFQETMREIYSSSVCYETLDEAPAAYKNSDEVLAVLAQTVQIEKKLKTVYNFKAI